MRAAGCVHLPAGTSGRVGRDGDERPRQDGVEAGTASARAGGGTGDGTKALPGDREEHEETGEESQGAGTAGRGRSQGTGPVQEFHREPPAEGQDLQETSRGSGQFADSVL